MKGRALAAMLAAGNFGGVPLPMLSRRGRERLKRHFTRHYGTYFPPNKRNGARECARRVRQMANYTHGY